MSILRSLRIQNLKSYQQFMLKNFHQKRLYSYEADGKTSVSFLSREAGDLLMITAYNKLGFRLSSGIFIVGPVIMFPKTVLSWNVANDDDINTDSLALFYNLEPPVDLLVIGLGDDNSFKNQTNFMSKFNSLKQSKLNFELLTTDKAISTYNFLCIENRFVAAALIPPVQLDVSSRDFFSYEIGKEGKDDYFLGDDCKEIDVRDKEAYKKFQKEVEQRKKPGSPSSFFSFLKKTNHSKKE